MLRSSVGVPITAHSRTIGALGLTNEHVYAETPDGWVRRLALVPMQTRVLPRSRSRVANRKGDRAPTRWQADQRGPKQLWPTSEVRAMMRARPLRPAQSLRRLTGTKKAGKAMLRWETPASRRLTPTRSLSSSRRSVIRAAPLNRKARFPRLAPRRSSRPIRCPPRARPLRPLSPTFSPWWRERSVIFNALQSGTAKPLRQSCRLRPLAPALSPARNGRSVICIVLRSGKVKPARRMPPRNFFRQLTTRPGAALRTRPAARWGSFSRRLPSTWTALMRPNARARFRFWHGWRGMRDCFGRRMAGFVHGSGG